jgi:hypothetical protein
MAKKDELIVTAESLGIATEGLTVAKLEDAIADKKAEVLETGPPTASKGDDSANTNTKTLRQEAEEAQANADAAKVVFEEAQAIADAAKFKLVDEATVAAKTKELATAFAYGGKTYGLSDLTPKTLRVLEDVYTQEELLQNKDAMEFLIVGNSCFIKRLK